MVRFCPSKPKDQKFRCYKCGGPHLARDCQTNECASGCTVETVSGVLKKVPVIEIKVEGRKVLALVDTGCTQSMVVKGLATKVVPSEISVAAFDGRKAKCLGHSQVNMMIGGESTFGEVKVLDMLVGGLEVVLGMDIINKLGGVTVVNNSVKFGKTNICAMSIVQERTPEVSDEDFEAYFDGHKWSVRYLWNQFGEPALKQTVGEYKHTLDGDKTRSYETEIERWIKEGILSPWTGEEKGNLPLMAVEQVTKNKIRPVLDFRELNKFVKCHTGSDMTDICSEKLREWRQIQGKAEIVDLKAAYLQIYVVDDLWKHQLVKYKEKLYCLTRLGFGLNSAPKIMSSILKTVLSKDKDVEKATSSYVDDICVNTDIVSSEYVIDHLNRYGLVAKAPEQLDGGSALGLKIQKNKEGVLMYHRANELPEVIPDKLTKKELFSICGKLIGHYPVAGWLRPACSYAKRHAEGENWNDDVGDKTKQRMSEMLEEVKKNDPVRGQWKIPSSDWGTVWTDASDLAMGTVIEVGGVVAEDGSWMRKSDDYNHINVAELEAVLKGVNLCVKWGLKNIILKSDSAIVVGWVKLTLSGEKRIKTKGSAEMLIKRRLGTLKTLKEELNLVIDIEFVKSESNKADALTRVRRRWMQSKEETAACISAETLRELHNRHHMGVERTWYLAKKVDAASTKEAVKKIIEQCEQCQSIDPAPKQHQKGELGVETTWTRASIDVTHYQSIPYLSLVDCGPGRFAIWRTIKGETAIEICKELENIFYERGPVKEVLLDNAPAFRSEEMKKLMLRWGIQPYFRAAYRPGGNGIVERHHRTIKRASERAKVSPIEAVYWYNMTPRYEQKEESVPHRNVHTYEWKMKGYSGGDMNENPKCEVEVGEEVWVKPGNARCTTKWKTGTVTKINSQNNVDIDGIARHILDIRQVMLGDDNDGAENGDEPTIASRNAPTIAPRTHPRRERVPPEWTRDFQM